MSTSHESADATRFWESFVGLIEHFGETEVVEGRGVRVTLGPRTTALISVSRTELHRYVSDYLQRREESKLDGGLVDGLPNPLADSIIERLGSQRKDYARYRLIGWDLREV